MSRDDELGLKLGGDSVGLSLILPRERFLTPFLIGRGADIGTFMHRETMRPTESRAEEERCRRLS